MPLQEITNYTWVGHALLPHPPAAKEPAGAGVAPVMWVPYAQWALSNVVVGLPADQRAACRRGLGSANPWVSGASGRALIKADDGTYYLTQTYCTSAAQLPLYPVWALDGTLAGNRPAGVFDRAQPPIARPPLPIGGLPPGTTQPGGPVSPGAGGGINIGGLHLTLGDIGGLISNLLGKHNDTATLAAAGLAIASQVAGLQLNLSDLPPALAQQLNPALNALAGVWQRLRADLATNLGAPLDAIGKALDQVTPGLGSALKPLVADATNQARTTSEASTGGLWAGAVKATGSVVREVEYALADGLKDVTDTWRQGLTTLVTRILDALRADLEDVGQIHAGNVDRVAGKVLADVASIGATAQLAAMGIELLDPIKELGLQEALVGFLELTGMRDVGRRFLDPSLRYAIGLPAEYRAAAHFRTLLPPLEHVRFAESRGDLPAGTYLKRLELEGYAPPYPEAFNADLYKDLGLFDIARGLDGSEADTPWIARMVRNAGYSPENADKYTKALTLKTTAPGRTSLSTELLTAHTAGELSDEDLQAGLDAAGLSLEHRTVYLRAAQLKRRHARITAVMTEVQRQYEGDIITGDTMAQMGTALGLTPDELTVRRVVADLKRDQALVKTETAAIEGQVRRLKAAGLKEAEILLRAGFLDRGAFVAGGVEMGYAAEYMTLLADQAAAQGPPTSKKGQPAIGKGALQETVAAVTTLVTQEVTLKRVTALNALRSLRAMGLPADLASLLVQTAGALAGPEPLPGDYGLPPGAKAGPAFGVAGELVATALAGIQSPAAFVAALIKQLGLSAADQEKLGRILRDVKDLYSTLKPSAGG